MGVKGFINNRRRICLQIRDPEAEYTGPAFFIRCVFLNAAGE
jgi:hypothetical protein